jgi:hypothetical protein
MLRERMGLRDTLRQPGNYLRKLRQSLGYYQYKRGRKYEREQADHAREHAEASAERERKETQREREHAERYARERTQPAEETEPDR